MSSPVSPDQPTHPSPAKSPQDLLPKVYDELRRLANARLARLPPGQTLEPTALVHEAYLRLSGAGGKNWDGRTAFFAAAARAMRDIVVERVRQRRRARHGGGMKRNDVYELALPEDDAGVDVLALHELLVRLESQDRRLGELVTMRYFAGATLEQAAESLGISLATANRDWRFAKAWLLAELQKGERRDESRHRS
ncbi:MAG: ECF-type sigma factor [Phycisphaerae bacterium]